MKDKNIVRIAVESHVYSISEEVYAEVQKHLLLGNDDEWTIALDMVREKGKFLFILDGNYNY